METTANLAVTPLDQNVRALEDMQRAMLNILEDFNTERQRQQAVQSATVNILEDFISERDKLADLQRGTLNILEDSDRRCLEETQSATINILDDFASESEKLAQLSQELQASNKELEAFTYSVAHDLRAPLRQIDGFSKILLEEAGPQLDETAQRYLQRVREGAGSMGQLVDAMLGLARLGRQQPRCQITDLNSLVNEILAHIKSETGGRNIEWRIGRLPLVSCDAALIKIVLVNLLSNAVKFTRPRELALIKVGSIVQDGETVMVVRDNGVGFNMKYADKLFGVFQRLHRAQEFEGMGIGLATVQRIVHKHGGRIWTEAELGKGATFYFTLGKSTTPEQGA